MAIITLNCNLNGGDDVTPNNELFYRIYGDVDNYASPIHTTGTAIADANVTVNADVVVITSVDGTTNTSFKIAAVDEVGNEGVLSDAVAFSGYILDAYPDAIGAYSLRKLKSTATLALGLRRDSDDQITNLLLEDSGSITINSTVSVGGTLANWAGTDNVYVTAWYDQSGNGNDAVEDTLAEQPAIMYSGALQERNLKPSIDFHFAAVGLLQAPRLLSANTWSINGVIYNDEAPTNAQAVLSQHSGTADVDRVIFAQIANTDLKQRFNFNNGASISGLYSTDWITVGQTLFSNYASGNNYYWKDNGGAYETLVTGESLTPLNTDFNIGAYGNGSEANNFKGHMQEIIVWDSDKSSDRVDIENNINDFYNVY